MILEANHIYTSHGRDIELITGGADLSKPPTSWLLIVKDKQFAHGEITGDKHENELVNLTIGNIRAKTKLRKLCKLIDRSNQGTHMIKIKYDKPPRIGAPKEALDMIINKATGNIQVETGGWRHQLKIEGYEDSIYRYLCDVQETINYAIMPPATLKENKKVSVIFPHINF